MYFFVLAIWMWNVYLYRLIYLRMFPHPDTKTFGEPE